LYQDWAKTETSPWLEKVLQNFPLPSKLSLRSDTIATVPFASEPFFSETRPEQETDGGQLALFRDGGVSRGKQAGFYYQVVEPGNEVYESYFDGPFQSID
jgi:hypothetical protein